MGNGVWTVEIIPAEIQPPPRVPEGASGYRIRIGAGPMTNWGDFDQPRRRLQRTGAARAAPAGRAGARRRAAVEDKWATTRTRRSAPPGKRGWPSSRTSTIASSRCRWRRSASPSWTIPGRGRTCSRSGCSRASTVATWSGSRIRSRYAFRKKSEEVYTQNVALLELGYAWAEEHLDFRIEVTAAPITEQLVVMNGNEALGLGAIAAGMELCAMYPITPATSVSHYLSEVFERFGGMVHQAEDEIAAVGVAIGASYAGKVALHGDFGSRPRAEDRVPRPRRDDRDPAGADRCAARRSEHRTADQGGAVGSPRGALREPGRRAAYGHGAGHHRGVLPRHGHGPPTWPRRSARW